MNGEGSEEPTWLFVGEAPGGDEDEQGYPFVGEAGSELRQGIEDVGIPIGKCRFSNAVRCRPPDNDLKKFPKAVDYCRPHILREIRATRPKVTVLLGNSAIKSLLNKTGILKLHGEVIDVGYTKFVCVFHPAYLLRNDTPSVRRKFYDALRVAKRVATQTKLSSKVSKRNHVVILDKMMLKEAVDIIKKAEYPATDIESSTLSPFSSRRIPMIGVIGVAHTNKDAFCFPIDVRTGLEKCKISPREALEAVKEVWEYPGLKWLCHNGGHDMAYPLVLHDIWLGGKGHKTGMYYDGMLGSYALDERSGVHGLKDWAVRCEMPDYDQPLKQYKMLHPEADPERGGNLLLVPAEILYPYNADDCICTRREFFIQRKKLKAKNLWDKPLMFPLMYINWILMMMRINGMKASLERNKELNEIYNDRIDKLDTRLKEYNEIKQLQRQANSKLMQECMERVEAYKRKVPNTKKKVLELYRKGVERKDNLLNLNSPDVRRELVFDVLGYEPIMKTETGLPSVERWILEELNKKHRNKILTDIIQRTQYSSFHAKYIGPLPTWIESDKKIHSSFLPHGTVTGRPSSSDPNMYNLPARHPLTNEIMTQFVPSSDKRVIAKQDSKQIELRLIADRAKDKVMIQEFRDGKDPHAMGAQAANELTEKQWMKLADEIRKRLRGEAKNAVSFGLVYGREAPALAADFGWSLRRGQDFKTRYFTKYCGIRDYLEAEHDRILKEKRSISSFGRHRRLPEAESEHEGTSNRAVREGINAPIQGDASDINLIAAYRLERLFRKRGMKSRTILSVYDAVYVDTYIPELKFVIRKLHEFMTDRDYLRKMTGWNLRVPLDTDCAIGVKNMGEMIELKMDKESGLFVMPDSLLKA
jgi:uracil-DNA glycosylase family 4